MKILRLSLFAFCMTAASVSFAAELNYPSKPIRFIVPNEPGGTTDVLIRALGPSLTKTLGQSVIVENRAGASATIGSSIVARSPADGYTLLVGSSATSSNAYVLKNLPYDAEKDLELIARIAVTPYFLIVNTDLKATNVQELVVLAKAHPGRLTYASAGTGTSPHLSGARFGRAAGLELLHVPYKGTAPALNDLIAGRVDLMFVGLPSTIGQIKAGRLRALAIANDQRVPSMPGVPTMTEAGVKGFTANSWFGVLAPKGTPEPVKEKIANALKIAVHDSEVQSTLNTLGAIPISESPSDAQKYFESDLKFWKGEVEQFRDQLE